MSTITEPRDSAELHPDCLEDCCWEARLAMAGGRKPITAEGVANAVRRGLISRDDEGELVFHFERLPEVALTEADLAEAAELREEYLRTRVTRARGHNSRYVRNQPELRRCIEWAVKHEVCHLDGLADWLDLERGTICPSWVMDYLIPELISRGMANREVSAYVTRFGMEVPRQTVATRRRRLNLAAEAAAQAAQGSQGEAA